VQRRQSFRASVTFSSIKVFKHNHPEGKYQVRSPNFFRIKKRILLSKMTDKMLKICAC